MVEQNQELMAIQEPHNQNTLDVSPIKHSVGCVFVLRKTNLWYRGHAIIKESTLNPALSIGPLTESPLNFCITRTQI